MHYMVGTDIVMTASAPRTAHGPQPLNAANIRRVPKSQYFEPGVRYTLYNIRPQHTGQIEYSFQRQDGKIVSYVFESVSAAERVIASARGEDLPDYDSYYRDN
jgi:hypothetical protein